MGSILKKLKPEYAREYLEKSTLSSKYIMEERAMIFQKGGMYTILSSLFPTLKTGSIINRPETQKNH